MPSMIFGVNTAKDAVFIAETHGAGNHFKIDRIRRVQFQLHQASDVADLLQNLSVMLDHNNQVAGRSVAILRRSGGRFGASVGAIKAEAMAELAAFQKGLPVVGVAPQSLKKALGCAQGEKWRAVAKLKFNHNEQHSHWKQGADGAVSAAYKVAGS